MANVKQCHKCQSEIQKDELALCVSLDVQGCWVQAFECEKCNAEKWAKRHMQQVQDAADKAQTVERLRDLYGEFGFISSWKKYKPELHEQVLEIFKKRKREIQ